MVDVNSSRRRRVVQVTGLGLGLVLLAAVWGYVGSAEKAEPHSEYGGIPTFKTIELLKIDGQVLGDNDKIMFGSPEFSDWDGDGKTDLILGYWAMWSLGPRRGAGDGGKVRLYKNISETPVPQFKDMGDLECHGGLVRLAEA
jgi:hypothetical protein